MLKQANLSFSVAAQSFGDDVTSIQFSTQDKNTAKLIFTIKEGKKPLDLTDAEGIVDLVMGDKSIFEDNKAIVTAPLDGKLEYTITADQIRHPGRARGELQLISKDGQSIGGFRFNFTIKKALVDEYAGPVKEYYVQDLEAIKAEIRKTADSIKDLDVVRIDSKLDELEQKVGEGGVGVDEQARQEIQEVTAQLAETAKQTYSKSLSAQRKPLVTFYLDDGYENDYTIVYPKAKSLGIPVTVCLHNDSWLVENKSALDRMVKDGWEVHAHTIQDQDLTLLSYDELIHTMKNNKELLESYGYEVNGLCYPRGRSDEKVLKATRELFKVGMGSDYFGEYYNTTPIDTYSISRIMAHQDTTRSIKSTIDEMIEKNNGWLIIYTHTYTFTTDWGAGKDALFELMDYATSKNVDVVTVDEAMKTYGNQLDLGDARYTQKVFKVGSDGKIDSSSIPIVNNQEGVATINSRSGTAFESSKLTITYLNAQYQSNIPFDSGRGTLYTDRLREDREQLGNASSQIFHGSEGTVATRIFRGDGWTPWTTIGGTNMIKTKQYTINSPVTDFPDNVVTNVTFSQEDRFGNINGDSIGTLITSRLTGISVANYQMFFPYNNNKIYKRYWLGAAWSDWEMHIPFISGKIFTDFNFGEIQPNTDREYTFEVNAKSTENFVDVNFQGGLPSAIMATCFIKSPTDLMIRLRNVSSNPVIVGYKTVHTRIS